MRAQNTRSLWKSLVVCCITLGFLNGVKAIDLIETIAGSDGGEGVPATTAIVSVPYSVTRDSSGNLYIADPYNHRVRKVTSAGIISTFAGNGVDTFSGDGGQATLAGIPSPRGLAFDSAGNLYISDDLRNCVRKVTPAGIISTVVGSGDGTLGFSGDGGAATLAKLNSPRGLAFDSAGNLYIADQLNNRIRRVNSSGIITTVVGNGSASSLGDGGFATEASINDPWNIVITSTGTLYLSEYQGHRIRAVNAAGIISTFAGNGTAGFSGDGGSALAAKLNRPAGMALDAAGNLFIADCSNQRVRKVSGGLISTVAGNGVQGYSGDGGVATSASLKRPTDVTIDATGSLYIADSRNSRVRKVNTSNVISTIAGNGTLLGDGGQATKAIIKGPLAAVEDKDGNMYIVEEWSHTIRKVSPSGIITTVAGTGNPGFSGDGGPATAAELNRPWSVAVDGTGNLYIADAYNHRIRKVNTSGIISTIAGSGVPGFTGDGVPATSSGLLIPYGVILDPAGNLYIADTYNQRIRKVNTSGIITTVAGNGLPGLSGDGGPATAAALRTPYTIAMDGSGNLYIADTFNSRIRKVNTAGIITTYAGKGSLGVVGSGGDGGPATQAWFNYPPGVGADTAGNVYVADGYNGRIRKIDTAGIINTIAGNGVQGFSGDGGPATSAKLNAASGVWVNDAGDVYIADTGNNRIRLVYSVSSNQLPVITSSPSATPNPVVLPGTANLSVNASDADGPATLTYTWTKVSGPGTVSFSPNGNATSKNSVATFSVAGAYVLQVSISDGAASITSSLGVTVNVASLPTVTITASDATASEPGTDIGRFLVKRTGSTSSALIVKYLRGGTAVDGVDYNSIHASTITIPAGASQVYIDVTPKNDALVEGKETVTIKPTADAAYILSSNSIRTVNIYDDEKPTITLKAADAAASEAGDTGRFTITRIPATSAPLAISYSISGTASNNSDYIGILSNVTIPANVSIATIMITPKEDVLVEGEETIILTLPSSSAYEIGTANNTVKIADND